MKNALRDFCAVLVLSFAMFGLTAPAGASQSDDDLERFLEVTGFDVALTSMKQSAMDAPFLLGMDGADFGPQWPELVGRLFDADSLQASAKELLGPNLSDEMREHALTFYGSDLGQRLVAVENAAHSSTDEGEGERGEALVAEMVEAGSPRLDVLKRMNHAVDPQNIGVQAIQTVQIGFLLAASDAGVINRIDEATLRSLMQEQAAEMSIEIEKSALASAAAIYESFSDDELETYADALEDPVMAQVYELMNGVQYGIMALRYQQLGTQMGELGGGEEL